jgi:hypothetical protein
MVTSLLPLFENVYDRPRFFLFQLVICVEGHVTFAEIANVDNHLSFADQGKQTSVFRIYIYIETAAYKYMYIYISISNIYV